MQTICHILAEIGDKLPDARFVSHLGLGGIPERRGHREEEETVIHQMLQQELLIGELLPMAERRGQRRTCQAS